MIYGIAHNYYFYVYCCHMIFPVRTIKLYCIVSRLLPFPEMNKLCCSSLDTASSFTPGVGQIVYTRPVLDLLHRPATDLLHRAFNRSFTQGLGQILYTGLGTDLLHRACNRSFTQGLRQIFYTGPWTELSALSFANKNLF